MIRLALNVNSVSGQLVALSISDQHYLRDVMRKKAGDALEVLALDGSVWRAQIGENVAVVQLLSWAFMAWTPDRYITLYQALLKGDHFGEVVDRATQAGVSRFVPLITERTIVREVTANRVARWQALAREASEQSRRAHVPEIGELVSLSNLTVDRDCEGFVLHPSVTDLPTSPHPWINASQRPLALVVGPEGGFTTREISYLTQVGFRTLSLGPAIFRAENAGAFAAVLFLH